MTKTRNSHPRLKYRMTEEDFLQVRQLLDMGLKAKQVAVIVHWSVPTIARVQLARTYSEYLEIVRAYAAVSAANRSKKAGQEDTGDEDAHNQPEEESVTATPVGVTHHDPIERIAAAMERLADAWESSPKKKGLFKN